MAYVTENVAGGAVKTLFGFKRVHLEPGSNLNIFILTRTRRERVCGIFHPAYCQAR